MAKSNIDYLRQECAENDNAIEWIDAVENELDEAKSEIKEKEKEISELEDKVSDLEDEDPPTPDYETINCGIDNIEYVQPSAIDLQSLMEQFKEAIKKNGYKKVSETLAGLC